MSKNEDYDCYVTGLTSGDYDRRIKHDGDKLRLTTVSPKLIYAVAAVREYGIKKYGSEEAWRSVEVERYRDALARHGLAYLADPHHIDEESGLPTLWHLACNVNFLVDKEEVFEQWIGVLKRV